jgi:hypothetical protein
MPFAKAVSAALGCHLYLAGAVTFWDCPALVDGLLA